MSKQQILNTYTLTKSDKELLKTYKSSVEGFAKLIGPHCEVVLHSLDNPDNSVIAIANGHNTNRKIGAPMTDIALKVYNSLQQSPASHTDAYFTHGPQGQPMKSITIAINNPKGKLIGLLCININLNISLHDWLKEYSPTNSSSGEYDEHFATNSEELLEGIISETLSEFSSRYDIPNKLKNKHIILALFERGAFNLRGSVEFTAKRLCVSKHTIYTYLRQKKQNK